MPCNREKTVCPKALIEYLMIPVSTSFSKNDPLRYFLLDVLGGAKQPIIILNSYNKLVNHRFRPTTRTNTRANANSILPISYQG